jgi:hypothetical protein
MRAARVTLCLALLSTSASAQEAPQPDVYRVPLAPRPPTLPELTHPDFEIAGETTVGVVSPGMTGDKSDVLCVVQTLSAEAPIERRRRIYAGLSYALAFGEPPGGGPLTPVPSNLELHGRVVWATATGLTFGGGVAVLAPTAEFDANGDAAKVAAAAQAVRPWDQAYFLDDTTTLRGFVDVRDIAGPVALQFREGLEWSPSLSGSTHQVTAVAQVYLGYRVIPLLGVGIEAFETYIIYSPAITTIAQDHDRGTFTVSPSIRLMTPYVQPALGFVTSIGDPLFGSGTIDGFWGFRIGASIVWDPWSNAVHRGTGVPPARSTP